MHVQVGQILWCDPFDFAAFAARATIAADEAGTKADRELLPHLSVVVSNDVAGVGVNAGDRVRLDVVAGLFLHLARDGVTDGFTLLMGTAWERPEPVVGLVDQQNPASFVLDDRNDGRHDAVDRRGVGVIDIVDACHVFEASASWSSSPVLRSPTLVRS